LDDRINMTMKIPLLSEVVALTYITNK